MTDYNKEIRDTNKQVDIIKQRQVLASKTSHQKHRSELQNIKNKLTKDTDRERANMEVLSNASK